MLVILRKTASFFFFFTTNLPKFVSVFKRKKTAKLFGMEDFNMANMMDKRPFLTLQDGGISKTFADPFQNIIYFFNLFLYLFISYTGQNITVSFKRNI